MPSIRSFPLLLSPRFSPFLRHDAVAGVLLLAATLTALVWANGPASASYEAVRTTTFGPAALDLHLSVQAWAADGLLAVFFFVVGLELKRELVVGSLRNPRAALVPIAAAVGGVAVPAIVYLTVNALAGGGAAQGWAIPAATDIAFVLAVLAVVGRGLPPALRIFLLTLAVVDDLIAITIIAVGYTDGLRPAFLMLSAVPLSAFAVLTRRYARAWWLLLPLAFVTWTLVHASGVHATAAGVLLGLVVPAREVAARFEHRWQPWSVGLAIPVFALFAAGVDVGGIGGVADALGQPVALGIMAGLVIGKPLGITLAAWFAVRASGTRLDPSLTWADIMAAGCLAGIGFTVSLLIGDLSFGAGTAAEQHVKIAVLTGSTIAAAIGGTLLHRRRRRGADGRDPARSTGRRTSEDGDDE